MNIDNFLKDIHEKLEDNSEGVPVFREQFVPESANDHNGFIAWDVTFSNYLRCSDQYVGVGEGELDVIAWSTNRVTRSKIHTSVLDLFLPGSPRDSIAPIDLSNTYLHQIVLVDTSEVFSEKEGHPFPEISGVLCSFQIKVNL